MNIPDINGLAMNPVAREYHLSSFRLHVSAPDGLNTLVRGQKLLLSSLDQDFHMLTLQLRLQDRLVPRGTDSSSL